MKIMKTIGTTVLFLALAIKAFAQTDAGGLNQGTTSTDILTPSAYKITSLGANFNVWQYQTTEPGPNGQVATRTHSYT